MAEKQKELDITKTGPVGYKSLQAQNNAQFDEVDKFINESQNRILSVASQSNPYSDTQQMVESPLARTNTPWGESMWDNRNANQASFENLGDIRAENQPWYAQIGAGVAKGAVLAGTTFLDGTAGTIFGALNAVDKGKFSAFWDNDFGKAMSSINEWADQYLPNYRTKEEELNDDNGEWYKNIFTANWLGDKFIKNLGFTIGAFATGNLVSSALGSASGLVKSIVGSGISAINEGKVEALNNAEEFYNNSKQQLDDYYNNEVQKLYLKYGDTPEFYNSIQEYNKNYEESLAVLNENKAKMGNVDFALNLPILLASNMFMWGKLYAGGSKNAISAMKIAKRNGKYTSLSSPTKAFTGYLGEGVEELAQSIAKEIPSIYYGNETENFYKSKFDKDAEQKVITDIQSIGLGISSVLENPNSWEEFAIGALTGAIGMPQFRSIKNSEGKWRSPITINGGIIGEYNEYKENKKKENEIIDYLNNRISNNKDFLNYYQGYIRHNKYQNDMDKAAEEGDIFEFKNAEESQLISDIVMFDRAGKLNDLKEMLEQAYDTSDENIEAIIKNTTDKNGNGPFSNNGNTWGKSAILQEIRRTKEDIQDKIEYYKKVKDKHLRLLGDKLENDQLAELTWSVMKHENYKNRFNQIVEEIRDVLKTNNAVIEKNKGESIKDILELDNESLISTLSSSDNKEFVKAQNAIRHILEKNYNLNSIDIESKLSDLKKLAEKTDQFYNRYKDLINNPNKIVESIQSIDEEVSTIRNEEEVKKRKESIMSSTNFKDIQDKLDTGELEVKDLEESDSKLVKDFIEASKFKYLVYREIENSDATNEEKEQLKDMVDTKFNDYDNYSDFSNSDLNVDLKYENQDELDYKLKSILDKVNKDTKSISSLKVGTVINPKKKPSTMIKDTTGNDKNADVPPITTKNEFKNIINDLKSQPTIVQDELKPSIYNVKNLYFKALTTNTQEDYDNAIDSINTLISYIESEGSNIINDTKFIEKLNSSLSKLLDKIPEYNSDTSNKEMLDYLDKDLESLDNKKSPKKEYKYYAPIIPEFSINELKNGEFKPFNVANPNYSNIYDYLDKAGAFKYVNEGNLKKGDKLDLKLEKIGDYDEIVMYKGNQVVGTLPSLKTATDNKYIGLPKVIERVKNGESVQLTVNKILLGKYRYNRDTPQSLKNLNKDNLKLGIQETPFGNVTTNTKDVVEPVYDEQNAVGKVYVLLPNSRGTLSPKLVRVKHFNKEEFDLELLRDKGNSRAIALDSIIKDLTKVDNPDKATNQLNKLRRILHLDKTFHLNFEESNTSTKLVIRWKDSTTGKYNRNYIKLSKVSHSIENGAFEIGSDGSVTYDEKVEERIDESIIYNQILDVLYNYNPVFNVNKNKINTGTYNNDLINDDILYTYLTSTQMEGSWFTTNYISETGEEGKAENPKGMFNPSTKDGIRVLLNNKEYTVIDDNIYDRTGKLVKPNNSTLIKDIAYCNSVYGSRSNDINMLDNRVLLHNGTIGLDRNTNKYIIGKTLEQLKFELNELPKKQARLITFINTLNEDQSKVKRGEDGKPDTSENDNGESVYRILEEDGNYYEYKRVHSFIGDQWTEKAKESFKSKEPNLALVYGNLIDDLSRNFFSNAGTVSKPDNMPDEVFNRLLGHLRAIKTNIENRGESLLTDRIVVFYKYPDGTRVAGELDALSINNITGEVSIYDFKTSKYTFHGEKTLFDKKGNNQIRSTKEQYALQLSSYKNIIESKYDISISNLAILPFVLKYDKNGIKSLNTERGILLPYVNSPISLSYTSGRKATPVNTETDIKTDTISNSVKGTFILESINGAKKVTKDVIPFDDVNGHKYYYYKHELPKSEATGEYLYRHYLILENGKSIDMTGITTEDNSDNSIFNEIFKQVKQNYKVLESDAKNDIGLGQPVVEEFSGNNSNYVYNEGDVTINSITSKNGGVILKFSKYTKTKSGSIKPMTISGPIIDKSSIDTDTIEYLIDNPSDFVEVQLLELVKYKGAYAGDIRVKDKDGKWTEYSVRFKTNPLDTSKDNIIDTTGKYNTIKQEFEIKKSSKKDNINQELQGRGKSSSSQPSRQKSSKKDNSEMSSFFESLTVNIEDESFDTGFEIFNDGTVDYNSTSDTSYPSDIGFEINTDGTVDYGGISDIANQLASVNPTNTEFFGNNLGEAPIDLSNVDLDIETPSTDYTECSYEEIPEALKGYLEDQIKADKSTWESASKEDKDYYLHCTNV